MNVVPLSSPLTTITSLASSRTCESRTINYITHASVLPSICLKYSRSLPGFPTSGATADFISQTTGEPVKNANGDQSITLITVPANSASPSAVQDASASRGRESEGEEVLDGPAFLSFEDWKKQRLEKEGPLDPEEQKAQTIKDAGKARIPGGISEALEAFGDDDGEIEADFGVYLSHRPGAVASSGPEDGSLLGKNLVQNAADGDLKNEKPRRRSKDAGKTCKERFNFASIDAGGQIMKTNPEAKSASALLSENRDAYMLNICQAKNKFLVIELSELILVETIAIANFEFFSSTFRQFRVSVSDRYPVKLDQWVELGIFEAENSRDIQAFLVEDSRIWARYLRVEFMSHFGNEFYCPVSLLRVHGRTMIQEIQDTLKMEQLVDGEILVPDSVTNNLQGEEKVALHPQGLQGASETFERSAVETTSQPLRKAHRLAEIEQSSRNTSTTPWTRPGFIVQAIFDKSSTHMCLLSASPTALPTAHAKLLNDSAISDRVTYGARSGTSSSLSAPTITGLLVSATNHNSAKESLVLSDMQNASSTSSSLQTTTAASLHPDPNFTESAAITGITKSSAASATHIPQPATQESFFKSVSKRLQQLEANSTLSLTYIEEQSRILRDAFMKVEKRQLLKITSFLENLNDTVLDELRKFGRQYDQIWQSTVIELETQRDQSQREVAAVSARLNILADELVFQKRMSIIQSILLLFCLGLVIFSRDFTGIDMPIIQNMVARSRSVSRVPFDGLTHSSVIQRDGSLPDGKFWVGVGHGMHKSNESTLSMRLESQGTSSPRVFPEHTRREDHLSRGGDRGYLLKGTQGSLMMGRGRSDHDGSCDDGLSPRGEENDIRTQYAGLQHGRRAHLERRNFTRSSDKCIGRQHTGNTVDALDLPSPPSEKENLDHNIWRKPLPALPKDIDL